MLISLVGSLYKLVAKVLADRLWSVRYKFISLNQLIFFNGRMLVDIVVVANEVIDLAKKSKINYLIFKVVFKKRVIQLVGAFYIICL